MRLFEIKSKLMPTPFPGSQIREVLYHGTTTQFEKFLRPVHGIFVTPHRDYADVYNNGHLVSLYVNSKKLKSIDYKSDPDTVDIIYDRDYVSLAEIIKNWISEGYDACYYGGEGESYILFGNIDIVNAHTGNRM